LVLVDPETHKVLVQRQCPDAGLDHSVTGNLLPRISIPRWSRAVAHIQTAIFDRWRLDAFVLDCETVAVDSEYVAIAELLHSAVATPGVSETEWITLDQLPESELGNTAASIILKELIKKRRLRGGPFLRLGWSLELRHWLSDCLGTARLGRLRQLNASARLALIEVSTDDRSTYWFKSVTGQNSEYRTTKLLAELFPAYLPEIVAFKSNWQAWFMKDAGVSLEDTTTFTTRKAETLGRLLASLQQESSRYLDTLLRNGIPDRRIAALRAGMEEILPHFEQAILLQDETMVARIGVAQIRQAVTALERACETVGGMGMPDAIVHNDLTPGNILTTEQHCVFTDWADASISNPFVAIDGLQIHFRQNQRLAPFVPVIVDAYCEQWRSQLNRKEIEELLRSVRLLTLAGEVVSRNGWLSRVSAQDSVVGVYLRSILRQMDRAGDT